MNLNAEFDPENFLFEAFFGKMIREAGNCESIILHVEVRYQRDTHLVCLFIICFEIITM